MSELQTERIREKESKSSEWETNYRRLRREHESLQEQVGARKDKLQRRKERIRELEVRLLFARFAMFDLRC